MKPNKIDAAHIRFQEWERVARDDEEMIKIGLKENSSPNPLCFHAQQMAEKFLKGFLAYHKQPPVKVHKLDQLLIACERIDSSFKELTNAVLYLNEFYIETRYPGDYPEFTTEDAKQAYSHSLEIAEFVRSKISLPSSARPRTTSLSAFLLLIIFTASLIFAAVRPGVGWGQDANDD